MVRTSRAPDGAVFLTLLWTPPVGETVVRLAVDHGRWALFWCGACVYSGPVGRA